MGMMKMPKEFYRTGQINSGKDSTRYGGEIFKSDFDSKYYCSDMSQRILRDYSFDKMCLQNIKQRKRVKKYDM
jgi:hypothetical protein